MRDRTIRGKETRRVTHGHPLGRQGQRAVEKINGRIYEKVNLNGTWYRVPLLRSHEVYPPEPRDIYAQQSDGVVWDDIRVAASSVKITGASDDPDFENIGGDLYLYAFSPTVLEQVFFTAQVPHSYKQGTDLHPHIHWMPETTNTDRCRWGLEYEWINIDGTYSSSTIIYVDENASGTALNQQMTHFTDISGIDMTISSMLICRLFRDAAHANDTFSGDAYFLEFDFHFEMDTMGSPLEYEK